MPCFKSTNLSIGFDVLFSLFLLFFCFVFVPGRVARCMRLTFLCIHIFIDFDSLGGISLRKYAHRNPSLRQLDWSYLKKRKKGYLNGQVGQFSQVEGHVLIFKQSEIIHESQLLDLPQFDLINFKVEYVRLRSGRFQGLEAAERATKLREAGNE